MSTVFGQAREIVTLSLKESRIIQNLMGKYGKYMDGLGYPSLSPVSTRKVMTSGTSAIVDYLVTAPGYLHIAVTHERSVLRTLPILNKDFTLCLDIREKKKARLVEPIRDPEVRAFLDKEIDKDGHTNLQALLQDYLPCEFAKEYLKFATMQRRVNDTTIEIKPVQNFEEVAEKGLQEMISSWNKEHLTDGWDVVSLTEKQVEKVCDTLKEHNVQIDYNNFALTKFCLSIFANGITGYYFFEKDGNTLHCRVPEMNSFTLEQFNVKLGMNGDDHAEYVDDADNEVITKWAHEKRDDTPECEENWVWCVNAFYMVNSFMLNFGDVTMAVETKEAIAPSKATQKKHKHRNSVRLFKTYKLIKGWKGQARKKAEITCLAWGVRGHFRHYRNGKTVFIDAYIKGKDREQYKGKEYALLPYKEA